MTQPLPGSVVDSAVYEDGGRVESPPTVEDTLRRARATDGAMAWVGLYGPADEEIEAIGAELGLHPLAVEDAIHAHQRPKLERYGDALFLVLQACRYIDRVDLVEVGELHVFAGLDYVVTLRHAKTPDLAAIRTRIEGEPARLAHGPRAVLHAIVDAVVDDFGPVVAKLEDEVDELEDTVFARQAGVSKRIYELTREVAEVHRALQPLGDIVPALDRALQSIDPHDDPDADPIAPHFRDVADHVARYVGRVDLLRNLLREILAVNATLVSEAQNEDVKRISAWAAIGLLPTLIASIYGMNFDDMPELHWTLGYPLALGLMAASSLLLYSRFKRRRWL